MSLVRNHPVYLLPGAESFEVDELPAYAPEGRGEHLWVRIEKRDLTTDEVANALARAIGCSAREVGYAGRKDRVAVARQWFSVRGSDPRALSDAASELPRGELRVLESGRDRKRLRLGDLAGNRFRLALGGDEIAPRLAAPLETLAREGLPNRFGAQRFGADGENVARARRIAAGESLRDPRLRKLLASAAQSAIFNAVLDARRAAHLLHRVRVGDVVQRRDGGLFRVRAEDLDDANERARPGRLAVLATGPLPGPRAFQPSAEVNTEEHRSSDDTGVDWAWFDAGAPLASPGARRTLVVPFLTPPSLRDDGARTWLELALPPGAYATQVLAELGVDTSAARDL